MRKWAPSCTPSLLRSILRPDAPRPSAATLAPDKGSKRYRLYNLHNIAGCTFRIYIPSLGLSRNLRRQTSTCVAPRLLPHGRGEYYAPFLECRCVGSHPFSPHSHCPDRIASPDLP